MAQPYAAAAQSTPRGGWQAHHTLEANLFPKRYSFPGVNNSAAGGPTAQGSEQTVAVTPQDNGQRHQYFEHQHADGQRGTGKAQALFPVDIQKHRDADIK